MFLRMIYFGTNEAETTINTMQVLERGYPSDTYKGKPLYENDSFITEENPKYALASNNYYNSINLGPRTEQCQEKNITNDTYILECSNLEG